MPEPLPDPVHALSGRLDPAAAGWLEGALDEVRADPARVRTAFPAVGRHVGRAPLRADADPDDPFAWTVDDAARVALLHACGDAAPEELADLYRYGDAAERRAVLRALPSLPVGDEGIALVEDALRTNDVRLVAAALDPYGVEHLHDEGLRQAVLKCAFVGIPLDRLPGLPARTDPELSRMLASYALERVVAGREVPADIWPLVDRHPPADVLSAIERERSSEFADRRAAAEAALSTRAEAQGAQP